MPYESKYIEPKGVKNTDSIGKAKIFQFRSKKKFSLEHTLTLGINKISLGEDCMGSSKIYPVVVQMWETKGDEKFFDIYSFDHKANCLAHSYNRMKAGKIIVHEAHDNDISRLVEHGETIMELIGDCPMYGCLLADSTVIDLRNNEIR